MAPWLSATARVGCCFTVTVRPQLFTDTGKAPPVALADELPEPGAPAHPVAAMARPRPRATSRERAGRRRATLGRAELERPELERTEFGRGELGREYADIAKPS